MHARPRSISVAAGFLVAGSVAGLFSAQSTPAPSGASVPFEKDVRPILETNCLSCHGEALQSGKFDLRTREGAMRGGARGSDIVPGDAGASRLYRRLAGLERPSMPAQTDPLPPEQVDTIKR